MLDKLCFLPSQYFIYLHCWAPTSLPRLDGGAISVIYHNQLVMLATTLKIKQTYVDWYLSRADTDREAVDDTSDSQHGNAVGSAHENRSNTPDDGANLYGFLSSEHIREVAGDQRSQP
jgi:hypothetical protein